MFRAVARIFFPVLLAAGASACSLPKLEQAEVDACKAQILASSGSELGDEKPAGWGVKVNNGGRTTTLNFAATDKHPAYICVLEDNAVTGIVEQKTIYEQAPQSSS